jgi:hypothetical protein
MSGSEGNKDKSMGIPDYEYTPNFRNALDHGYRARASMSKVFRNTSAPSLITRYVAV